MRLLLTASGLVAQSPLCCEEHDGTMGFASGVIPEPPSMRDSKLKTIPVDGVLIGIPAMSEMRGAGPPVLDSDWCLETEEAWFR